MAEKIYKIADRIIESSFYLLFVLVPLVLTPWNFELFEFNKMISVYFLTSVIVGAWLVKMIGAKKIIFKRSFWDGPLLVFLFSQVLAMIFSMDRHTSIWGYYTRAHGGLLSTISYLLLYWSYLANMDEARSRKAIGKLLIGAGLAAGYGILEHFGIDKNYWAQDVQNRVFSTLGQPNWLAAYLVALIFIPMALALNKAKTKTKEIRFKILPATIFYLLFSIFYLCLLFTKSRSGLMAFGISYFLFWILVFLPKLKFTTSKPTRNTRHSSAGRRFITAKRNGPLFRKFFIFAGLILVLTLMTDNPVREKIFGSPVNKTPVSSTESGALIGVSQSGDIRKIVWQGAIDIWRHYPVFGSGVETFAYSYYNFRPVEHNFTSEWDFLYNKAHNEYLNYLATTGAVGLGAYLLLIGSFIFWSMARIFNFQLSIFNQFSMTKFRKNKKKDFLQIALLVGFASILVTNFFGFSVVVIGLCFFLFPAITFTLISQEKKEKIRVSKRFQNGQYFLIILVLVSTLCILRSVLYIWYADVLFARANRLYDNDTYQDALVPIQQAIKLNPREPLYGDKFSLALAALSQIALSQEEASLSAQLAQLAIDESDQVLKMNPYHVSFWKNRTRIFVRLAELDPDFKLDALKSLIQASELAPTDAKISYNIALLYQQLNQKQTAIETLKETIKMKPNYKEAHFALALYCKEGGKIDEALEELKFIIDYIEPNDEGIKELINSWQKK